MQMRWFSKHLPSPQQLKDNRFLKPVSRYLQYYFLWQFNRRAVAGGVAAGLFFGILAPFLQIFLAALAAILLRVNLPVAAFSTLITNPLTFPFVYYLAYRIGEFLMGSASAVSEEKINANLKQVIAEQQLQGQSWWPNLIDWVQSIGPSIAIGVVVLATMAAIAGYFIVDIAWKLRVRWSWRRRCQQRAKTGAGD